MLWLAVVGALAIVIVLACILKGRKDPRARWTPGNFCTKCGARHPQDFGSLGPCPRSGGMDFEIRKGPRAK